MKRTGSSPIALLLVSALLFCLLPTAALAADGTIYSDYTYNSTENAYYSGNQKIILTADDVINISSPNDLANLSAYVNSGSSNGVGTWRLTGDVNARSMAPIGSQEHPFTGVFDGDGHTVSFSDSNLIIRNTSYIGLFGKLSGATVSNLTVSNLTVSEQKSSLDDHLGALAGYAEESTITGCSVTSANITGRASVGGLVGCAQRSKVSDCSVTSAVVTGEDDVGGIVGSSLYTKLTNCHTADTVTLCGENVAGGIAGAAVGSTILLCSNAAQVSGSGIAGGIAGTLAEGVREWDGNSHMSSSIYYSWNLGPVCTDESGSGIAGGIAGDATGNGAGEIWTCYNRGEITGNAYSGGICGWGGIVSNCYNAASVTGTCSYPIAYTESAGTAAGTAEVSVCRYDTSLFTSNAWDNEGCVGLTTAELQKEDSLPGGGWIYVPNEYPILSGSGSVTQPSVTVWTTGEIIYDGKPVTIGPGSENDIPYIVSGVDGPVTIEFTQGNTTFHDVAPSAAGTYTVRVTCGNTFGEVTFTIAPYSISFSDFQTEPLEAPVSFSGKPVTKAVSPVANSSFLTEERDYEVSYKNNTAPTVQSAPATVTITPKGSCTGTATALTFSFQILCAPGADAFIPAASGVYTVGEKDTIFQVQGDPTVYQGGIPAYLTECESYTFTSASGN